MKLHKPQIDLARALRDPELLGGALRGDSWKPWIAFLLALFALPLSPAQLTTFQKHTGRTAPPAQPCREAWLCCGRRAGKSFILSLCAVFLACFYVWTPYLNVGEVGTIMIIAADRKQARTIMRFILGLLESTPKLKAQIANVTQSSIELRNRVVLEIHTASFRSTRGYTILACLLDEIAFWPVDETSADQDAEVLAALKPAMATVPASMLLAASSPYAKKGSLWEAHSKHFGKDGDPVLIWQAATREMNATVPQAFIDEHMAEDEARARAEYMAEFRSDLEAFVSREALQACVATEIYERAHDPLLGNYLAFCDPSGGAADPMTLAIGHYDFEKRIAIIDCIREAKAPFSPELVVQEFCGTLAAYQIKNVTGDRYAAQWPVEMFGKYGVQYTQSERPKAELYQAFLPLLNSVRVSLLDHPKTNNQILSLERRTSRGGRDAIDHPRNQHDDLANVVAGCAALLNDVHGGYDYSMKWLGYDDPTSTPRSQAAQALSGFLEGMVAQNGMPQSLYGPRQIRWSAYPYQSPFRFGW
jgi:hypothetical protein